MSLMLLVSKRHREDLLTVDVERTVNVRDLCSDDNGALAVAVMCCALAHASGGTMFPGPPAFHGSEDSRWDSEWWSSSRCEEPARVQRAARRAGEARKRLSGSVAPLHAARTAQRARPRPS